MPSLFTVLSKVFPLRVFAADSSTRAPAQAHEDRGDTVWLFGVARNARVEDGVSGKQGNRSRTWSRGVPLSRIAYVLNGVNLDPLPAHTRGIAGMAHISFSLR